MIDYEYEIEGVLGDERIKAFIDRYNSLHPRDPQRWDMEEEAEILMGEDEDE